MKLSLPLKLAIAVVVIFALTITGLLLYRPVKVRYYTSRLSSEKIEERQDAARKLLDMNEKEPVFEYYTEKLQSEDLKQSFSGFMGFLTSCREGEETLVSLLEEELAYSSAARRRIVLRVLELWENNGGIGNSNATESITLLLNEFRFRDENRVKRILGATNLIESSERGFKALKRNLSGGEEEARFIMKNWNDIRTNPGVMNAMWFTGSAIHKAIENGYRDSVTLFLDKGFDVNTKGKNGITLLHIAAGDGKKDIVELLIERGADVNAMYPTGYPIHFAVSNGSYDLVELLIKKGADVNAHKRGDSRLVLFTALDEALEHNRGKIAELLRTHGGKTLKELQEEKTNK
ncbi:MAG: ankyrin repeat domain-containing protein [Planctomycetota bacterium]|jgi:hypothetical protein